MSVLRTHAAAAMLGVSPNTLRSWERRFGYPAPRRTAGGHRQFDLTEIEALRQAFEETHNVSSAISIARERGNGPSSPVRLRSALRRFEELESDRILEESLAVRSVERTVEEVLLPAVDGLCGREGEPRSAELGFALRWATGWLAAAKRVAPPPMRAETVLIFDASWACDIDSLHAQALELCLKRAGVRTLMLTAELDAARLAHVLRVLDPRLVVLAGRRTAWLAALSRVACQPSRSTACVDVLEFRGATDRDESSVPRLGTSATGARDILLARLNEVQDPARGRPALVRIS
jgi:DNA-binding transcriptional MerR regulator